MPSQEQTWYNLKLLHVLFAIASVALLVSTLWMIADDHTREWKSYQDRQRDIEKWSVAARLRSEQSALESSGIGQLEQQLALAESEAVDAELIDRFQDLVEQDAEQRQTDPVDLSSAREAVERLDRLAAEISSEEAEKSGAEAADRLSPRRAEAAAVREELLSSLEQTIGQARYREDRLAQEVKFLKANLTAAVSKKGLVLGLGEDNDQASAIQAEIDALNADIASRTEQLDRAKEHRLGLEAVVGSMTEKVEQTRKNLAEARADLQRMQTSLGEIAPNWREWIVRQPVLDAFYTGKSQQIDQIWLPQLTINYNFQNVARFDRCITCHRSIGQTAPGSAVDPAFVKREAIQLQLETPAEPLDAAKVADQPQELLLSTYGMQLAERGQLASDDVTVQFVVPESAAARAGIELGDTIRYVDDARIHTKDEVFARLLGNLTRWGSQTSLTVDRGLPHPFVSHPRLDLFVGSMSPHKMGEMGCTICHEGQGSATAFKWASHTPNDPQQGRQWHDEHGWFYNHHWIFPMWPVRFGESGCLKCHHEVSQLEPSERFPDPPAPKLVEGHRLVAELGCFGCHEINGYGGAQKRVGPDARLEPNYFAVGQTLLEDQGLSQDERQWATRLVTHPEDQAARRNLLASILEAGAATGDAPSQSDTSPRLAPATRKLAEQLSDIESPGTLRRVGPSLRHLASKVDFAFLYSWLRKPSDFRPSTRMPQFFGLWEHLEGDDLKIAERYEPVEIRAMSEYLLRSSRPFEYTAAPAEITETPSAERGRKLFETRGCLACHAHQDFPGIEQNQGPDLSRIGAKLGSETGRQWLYSWLKEPFRYHPRTVMPDLKLDPIHETDPQGKATGVVTDPAADIAAWLVESSGWTAEAPARGLSETDLQALSDLALEHLKGTYAAQQAEAYLENGIPQAAERAVQGPERTLLGMNAENRSDRLLEYVGRRTIAKYGCFGCHDIPGFEDAKPIGTALTDWGRKDPAKLAFELIHRFLADHGVHDGSGHTVQGEPHAAAEGAAHAGHAGGGHLNPADLDPDTGFYVEAILGHRREGFAWQKLRMPRSYDYLRTDDKAYNERLRMPRFSLNDAQREAILTFVLGLLAEPPAEQFVHRPDVRQQAIVEGRVVLEKYNCGGCHTLKTDRWEFDYVPHLSDDEPGQFEPPPEAQPDFPFLTRPVMAEQAKQSERIDARGLRHAVLHGTPLLNEEDGRELLVDEDGVPLEEEDLESGEVEAFYRFVLWQPAWIDGQLREVGAQDLLVRNAGIKRFPPWGGHLARYLFPSVVADEKSRNPQVNGGEAWGWLPPPLVREGEKVQSGWLHDFLLNPYPIRPAAVMRMPRFNMSSAEATALANYFAAIDGADYPYEYDPQREIVAARPGQQQNANETLHNALKIVVDGNYCVKCHLVGDYTPPGSPAALAPNLATVYPRLRPEFVRDWIANPKRFLPYTGMPVNVPYVDQPPHYGGVSQDLFPGSSIDQLGGLVELLMNFDRYALSQTSVSGLVKPAEATAATASPP